LPSLTDRAVLARLLEGIGTVVEAPRPVGDGFGFASERVRVTIDIDGVPRTVVVKVWDPRQHGAAEVDFYETWAPLLPVRLPALVGSRITADMAMLVLEDLGAVRQGDALPGLGRFDGKATAGVLAEVHRSTVGRPSDLPRLGPARDPDWHDSRRGEYLERFGAPESDPLRIIVLGSEAADRLAEAALSKSPPGLVHGDVHADNLLFLADGTPVLIDWSRPGWGAAAHDLAALLVSSLDPADYSAAIDAFGLVSTVTDDEITAAVLRQLVTVTLGIARWHPTNDRQERLIAAGAQRAIATAAWLYEKRPDLFAELGATR
jgi:streptomycin 6-kinase